MTGRVVHITDEMRPEIWCPACKAPHSIANRGWDGHLWRPTLGGELVAPGCISRVSGGYIFYRQSCQHHMAGDAVALPHHPET